MAIENIKTAAGATISISATLPATKDKAGFEAVTGLVALGEVTDLGEVGGSFGEATHVPLDSRLVQRLKTSFDAGTVAAAIAIDKADAGQILARTKLMTDDNVTVKITLPTGHVIWFIGLVMSFPINIGSVDNIISSTLNLAINSEPLVDIPA